MDPSILYQNADSTVLLIDIPRSIEAAQIQIQTQTKAQRLYAQPRRRLISSNPLAQPYPSVEPKSARAKANVSAPSLKELLLRKHLEFSLEEVRAGYEGDWCLLRVVDELPLGEFFPSKKLKRDEGLCETLNARDVDSSHAQNCLEVLESEGLLYTNPRSDPVSICISGGDSPIWIPPNATFMLGEIFDMVETFVASAPSFDIVVLDPPWPNRSARRKKDYSISYGNTDIRHLLSGIPLYDYLNDKGIIAVWITNKEVFRGMVLGLQGLFETWDVVLVEEWIWVKTTINGEPICALDSTWRKPYEVLLVGRRGAMVGCDVKRRVIIGVPDLHSRKPNLKSMFERLMLKDMVLDEEIGKGKYEALEIFARNSTAGWWSWGTEVLKFQKEECWVDEQQRSIDTPEKSF
ncbi:MT-A70-domain-containing protein [Rhexocercosporidium sp. MPI-PUGE-AT-0058]|nr:MT-A70-domain-containing protein [Rhexocercosporidium sp. MPI-PUGE-AT-0058]